MTDVILALPAVATLAASIWLAFDNNAVMALPLAIVFAELARAGTPEHPKGHHPGRGRAAAA